VALTILVIFTLIFPLILRCIALCPQLGQYRGELDVVIQSGMYAGSS